MKVNIRNGLFETNSSSTHTLIMCNEDKYKRLLAGELYLYYGYEYELIDKDKIDELIGTEWHSLNKEEQESFLAEHYIFSYEYWYNVYTYRLENFENYYTTDNGEVIVAFGAYGNDY